MKKQQYRADIDGLRAIAVMAVIFCHLDVYGFQGGFVGVDVFFVISGFLITSIILKDINANKFSVAIFYERRIRRIFPVFFSVIGVTCLLGAYFFEYSTFKSFADSIIAATVFSSNMLFWSESGYFDAPSLQKPLLHTWSLGVEEQFYIFFPLLLTFISRFLKQKYFPWLLSLAILSFLMNIYGVHHHPGAAFFFMPLRAWELFTGALVALPAIPTNSSPRIRNLISATGLGFIFFSIAFYTEATPFPGFYAIPPVLGTALIIHSGSSGPSLTNKILGWKPLVFIGLISYSLYLWHWPIIVFRKYVLLRTLNPMEIVLIIAITFFISILSWKFIEQPFRSPTLFPNRKKLFGIAAALMVFSGATGTLIHIQNGMPYRFAANEIMMDEFYTWDWLNNSTYGNLYVDPHSEKIPTIGSCSKEPVFALWGDSHAWAFIPALNKMANKYDITGYLLTTSGTAPVMGIERLGHETAWEPFNQGVIDFIRSKPEIKTVFLAARWAIYTNGTRYKNEEGTAVILTNVNEIRGKSNALLMEEGLFRSVDTLLSMKRNVVLISQIPEIGYDIKKLIWNASRFSPKLLKLSPTIDEYRKRNKEAIKILQQLSAYNKNVTLISPESMLFDNDGKVILIHNKKSLYRDDDHLSTTGSLFIAPAFENIFSKMSRENFEGEFLPFKVNQRLLTKNSFSHNISNKQHTLPGQP
ncbi:MAG: acyltransferase [Chlorobium sp.]|uniref:acyltransferase family protein n=1 Tax=Chlorobium sp. TaxID=1095 RepID=UPI0025BC5E79|nr:acyltransferase family protein [Chlorobium sp.]MCF8384021.1 acyltransferase [Chlorobium sp.]